MKYPSFKMSYISKPVICIEQGAMHDPINCAPFSVTVVKDISHIVVLDKDIQFDVHSFELSVPSYGNSYW